MKTNRSIYSFVRAGAIAGLVALTGLSVMIAPSKPAVADGLSISFSTNDFSIGYRSFEGGYRYWNPGAYDRYHRWHDGYYSGPVRYFPDHDAYVNRDRHFDNDHHFRGGDRDHDNGNWSHGANHGDWHDGH